MNIDIKLHKNDLPDDLDLGNVIAVDGEFMGLNVRRDPLCLIQVSSGNSDAHIKASLVGQSVAIPIIKSHLALGQWQGIFFAEFDFNLVC